MNARILTLSMAAAGAAVVACSKPADDAARAPGTEPVPALATPAPAAEQALVSPLEAGQRSELSLVRPAERKPPQPVVTKAPGEAAGAEAHSHHPALDMGEMTPTVTVSTSAPSTDAQAAPAAAPGAHGPAMGGGAGAGNGGLGDTGPMAFPDRGPMILIRGGMGGLDDDCKRHPMGYPNSPIPTSTAINNRMPPVVQTPVMANNPTSQHFGPRQMAGGIGVPRRGVIR